jgi:uncharacterized protein (DUF2252 family)
MLASPFAFLRGAAAVMAGDLAATPVTGLRVQACGDAHLLNFGAYATPERNLVFDLNDFDETLPGPWEWDVKRLAASLVVAGRDLGLGGAAGAQAAGAAVRAYRERLRAQAALPHLAVWYDRISAADVLGLLRGTSRRRAQQDFDRAARRDQLRALATLTTVVDGVLQLRHDPPLLTRASDPRLGDRVRDLYRDNAASLRPELRVLVERYAFVDAARKVVGVGSVGTRCYVLLLRGRGPDDPLFLQLKEARPSVLEPFAGASAAASDGERVVTGQRLLQSASDIFLGWGQAGETHYYVRQLQDMKGAADLAAMTAADLAAYGALCGAALARGHARSGDAAALSGYLGRGDAFDQAVVAFAQRYADQTERDHAALVAAVRAGRVAAEAGV